MSRLAGPAFCLLSTIWVGALWSVGYLVAPVLFAELDRALAGRIAGSLFSAVSWLGLGCGAALALILLARSGRSVLRLPLFWGVIAMTLAAVVFKLGIQPMMQQLKQAAVLDAALQAALPARFATWHGISSTLYLLQSVLGLWLVLGQRRLFR